MAYNLVVKVRYYAENEAEVKEYSKIEALESTVPQDLIKQAGRPLSYLEYRRFAARQGILPYIGSKDEVIALDSNDGTSYFTVLRGDILSATAEIVKTLDKA